MVFPFYCNICINSLRVSYIGHNVCWSYSPPFLPLTLPESTLTSPDLLRCLCLLTSIAIWIKKKKKNPPLVPHHCSTLSFDVFEWVAKSNCLGLFQSFCFVFFCFVCSFKILGLLRTKWMWANGSTQFMLALTCKPVSCQEYKYWQHIHVLCRT